MKIDTKRKKWIYKSFEFKFKTRCFIFIWLKKPCPSSLPVCSKWFILRSNNVLYLQYFNLSGHGIYFKYADRLASLLTYFGFWNVSFYLSVTVSLKHIVFSLILTWVNLLKVKTCLPNGCYVMYIICLCKNKNDYYDAFRRVVILHKYKFRSWEIYFYNCYVLCYLKWIYAML